MKQHSTQPRDYSVDERPIKGGGKELLCPFCDPPHPLHPDGNNCGAVLRVTAVRVVIPARVVRMKKLVCLKCGKGLGEMVHIGTSSYIHAVDCQPGTHIVMRPPKFDKSAEIVSKLPAPVRKIIEKRTGKASAMKEILPDGTETGKILGYFYYKDGNYAQATRSTT